MKVLFVSDDNLLRSVVYDIHVLAEGLSCLGHEVLVACSQRGERAHKPVEESRLARVYPNSKARLFRIGTPNIPKIGTLFAPKATSRVLRDILTHEKIDIIVIYSVIRSGLPAARLAREFKIPVVFRNIDMLHRLMPNRIEKNIVRTFEKKIYPQMNLSLALSPKYADYLATLGADTARTKLLPFAVDTDFFRPELKNSDLRQKWGLGKGDPIILYMGSLYSFSGLLDFVRVFPDILRRIPSAKLLIVGDGPLRARLTALVSKMGLKNSVLCTYFQPFQDMPGYVNLAKVCINTYPIEGAMKDLFCAKVVQYLACGKPTVSMALPGMTSMISGESCGVVYVRSASEMAQKIIYLLESSQHREELGLAGRAYAVQNHDLRKCLANLEMILKETVNLAGEIKEK